jgi:aerotaxis receptor
MPKAAFKELWDTVKDGKEWTGIVKNLRKDGLYYWVYSHITPIMDNNGKITGYTAARRPATPAEIEEVVPVYKTLIEEENK